jgi:mono/diheme cytochrome c family protein
MSPLTRALVFFGLLGGCHEDRPPIGGQGWFDAEGLETTERLKSHPTLSSDSRLAPISGGTLLVSADGKTAIVADPDRDRISVVDLERSEVIRRIVLTPGDQPGRSAQVGESRFVTVLRGAGQLLTFDAEHGDLERIQVCATPRGVTHDLDRDTTYVVCASGELVRLRDEARELVSKRFLALDLRDVWIAVDELRVSRFKNVEILTTDLEGTILSRHSPNVVPTLDRLSSNIHEFSASLAWRAIGLSYGGGLVVHQRARNDPILLEDTGTTVVSPYGSDDFCLARISQSSVSFVNASGEILTGPTIPGVLPVDLAMAPDRSVVAVAFAGSAESAPVRLFRFGSLLGGASDCQRADSELSPRQGNEAIAVAFTPQGELVIQWRDPSLLTVGARTSTLSFDRRADTGHLIFHMSTRAGIACASCHPEGGEDGHVWRFEGFGDRRTISLAGGIAGTEPFHWDGDMSTFEVLTDDVFTRRMGGPPLTSDQVAALSRWIDRLEIPERPEPRDGAAVFRGRQLFEQSGCPRCHAGARFQSGGMFDVGTGEPLQVPTLRGVVYRAPYLHNGCAATLTGRFGSCGGGDAHGETSTLSPAEIADLVQYLETL